MYFGALIQNREGQKIIVEAEGKAAFPSFLLKLRKYANKDHKVLKLVSDDPKFLAVLEHAVKKQLPHVEVCYGVRGILQLELEA